MITYNERECKNIKGEIWITLLYTLNEHIINQLYYNKKC